MQPLLLQHPSARARSVAVHGLREHAGRRTGGEPR